MRPSPPNQLWSHRMKLSELVTHFKMESHNFNTNPLTPQVFSYTPTHCRSVWEVTHTLSHPFFHSLLHDRFPYLPHSCHSLKLRPIPTLPDFLFHIHLLPALPVITQRIFSQLRYGTSDHPNAVRYNNSNTWCCADVHYQGWPVSLALFPISSECSGVYNVHFMSMAFCFLGLSSCLLLISYLLQQYPSWTYPTTTHSFRYNVTYIPPSSPSHSAPYS